MQKIPANGASHRDQFAQLLRQLLDRAGLSQAMLARRLGLHGIAQITEPRVSDWVHGRYVPRDEAVVFAIESILVQAGVPIAEGDLVGRYWAARREPKQLLAVAAHRPDASQVDQDPGVPQRDLQSQEVRGVGQAESRPSAAQAASMPALGSTRGRSISNLPHRNPNFTGRHDQMMVLENHLTAGQAIGAMTVHGLGGVGKTQLILEYAHHHTDDYDVVWWIAAQEPATVPSQLAALARRLDLPEQIEQAETVTVLLDELRHSSRWLLIFDNAEDPHDLHSYWPSGGGHVLVSSRNPAWRGIAATLCLEVLSREEAEAFLRRRLDRDDPWFAAAAEALGDLPLALEQAAAYLEETDTSTAEYLKLLEEHANELLALGRPVTTEQTIATTWTLSLQRLRQQAPAAEDLLTLCAFLAAEDIPRVLFAEHADELPGRLAATMGDPLTAAQAVGVLRRYALITTSSDAISLHRLVQAVVRCQLDPVQERHWTTIALRLIRAAFPPERTEYEQEAAQVYARLLPHALSVTGHGERLRIDPEATAWLLNETGSYLWQQAAHQEAYIALERARVVAETGLGHDHPITARSFNLLGNVVGDRGDARGSRMMHEQALAIRERLGFDGWELAESLSNLAMAVEDLGDVKLARSLEERAVAIAEERPGPTHRDTAIVIQNLAYTLHRDGELARARTLGERALAIVETSRGPDHPYTAHVLKNLASILADQGELDTARSMCERALAIFETYLGPNHPTTALSLNNLARILREQGDLNGARMTLERALDIRETRLPGNHPLIAATLGDLASFHANQGELDAACSLYERALAIRMASLGPDHPDTMESRQSLAAVVKERPKAR
jgi:tetratricopeptide (TPR) repeat protein/transcriptional regulator with XRE-family HTH domain